MPETLDTTFTLRNGTVVRFRPMRPDDEPLMVRFHQHLSNRTVFLRYFYLAKVDERVRHERLARLTTIDPATEAALVAVRDDEDGAPEIVAAARLTRFGHEGDAEVALLVSDTVQGQGLGFELLRRLCEHARRIGIRRLVGEFLTENDAMRILTRRAGFTVAPAKGDPQVLRAELDLGERPDDL